MIYDLRYYNFKGVTLKQTVHLGFCYISKKATNLGGGGCFLMFMYPVGLYDTDDRDDNTYNCHYNTHNPNDRFYRKFSKRLQFTPYIGFVFIYSC